MFTYQDFQKDFAKNGSEAIGRVIREHTNSEMYKMARVADQYDRQQNTTIMSFVKWLYSDNGNKVIDPIASNHKMCSNFFNRLNTQRMTYSLGNGITFDDKNVKEKLGNDIDTQLHTAGYYALIHGVAFMFLNMTHTHVFKVTEFCPLMDEKDNSMRAGVRFWQIDNGKPLIAILYEEDGYTRYECDDGDTAFHVVEEKRAYKYTITKAPAEQEPEVITPENYGGTLPIVPVYGSRLHQSTLVGMRSKIDGYDLIQSGFANDLTDCSEIYWLVSGAGASTDKDLARFRDRLKLNHIASVPNTDDVQITPYSQDIPYQARKEMLDNLRASIYEDFGGLDVHTMAAGATNDHIDAAYQPLDENADDYEYQIIIAVQQLLALVGVTGQVPIFKRNRISNQKEMSEMVLLFTQYLSDDTIRAHIPFLTADEIAAENNQAIADNEPRIVDLGDE